MNAESTTLTDPTVLQWLSHLTNTTVSNLCCSPSSHFEYCKHTHPFNVPCLGLSRWAGTRKAKPIWILLKQETVSGSGISWAICKSEPCSGQITMPAQHHSVSYRPDALPAAQPTVSKHWRQIKALKAKLYEPMTKKGKRKKLKNKKTDMLRSIVKQSRESAESVLKRY